MTGDSNGELLRIRRAYARRTRTYDPLSPWVYLGRQERERALIRWVQTCGLVPLSQRRLIELGCGTGGNLIELLRLGFSPANLVGNDLLPERIEVARERLPASVRLIEGDASDVILPNESFDVVFQSMMCSSILDDHLLLRIAQRMWALVRPGGGVLWYDFTYSNPHNPDVRGISIQRIRELFPASKARVWRVTLAPPISRAVTRIHPVLYCLFNSMPFLRTHLLCWLPKGMVRSRN